MHGYLKKLVDERNALTGLMQSLDDKAVSEERELTDAERERMRGWQERAASLDAECAEQNEYLTSQRAWAALQAKLREDAAEEAPGGAPHGGGGGGLVTRGGWGEVFTRSAEFAAYNGRGSSGEVEVGPVFDERAPIDTSWLSVPPSTFVPTPWVMTTPLLDAIGHERVTTGTVEWVQYPGTYPEAAIVAEGQLKPEADFAPTVQTASLKTIAHNKPITRQALEDIPRVQSIVENALRQGVVKKLESEAAAALTGGTYNVVENADLLAGIRIALGNVQNDGYASANAVLLNPSDFADLDLAVMGATVAGPVTQNGFWGLRAIAVGAIPAGTAYVGDFKTGVTMFERNTTSVYMTDSHADYFLRNILVILAETRALAQVTQPQAIQEVTTTVTP